MTAAVRLEEANSEQLPESPARREHAAKAANGDRCARANHAFRCLLPVAAGPAHAASRSGRHRTATRYNFTGQVPVPSLVTGPVRPASCGVRGELPSGYISLPKVTLTITLKTVLVAFSAR